MKRVFSFFLSMALVMSMLFSSEAFAQSQVETATYSGNVITCSLNCDFYVNSNDRATAKSIWNGKSGYQVSVALYQCQNVRDSYHKVDTDYGDIGARAIGSVSGVWKYKSEHGVRNNRNSKISRVCELTDW